MEVLTEKEYYTYHTQNLVPTKLKINSEIFVKEISKFNFMPWGDVHLEFPRYAVPLINEDGIFKENVVLFGDIPPPKKKTEHNFLSKENEGKNHVTRPYAIP